MDNKKLQAMKVLLEEEILTEGVEETKREPSAVNFNQKRTVPREIKSYYDEDAAPRIIKEMHEKAIIATVDNNEDLKEKVIAHAEKTTLNELNILTQKQEKRVQDATYDTNAEACSNYGVDKGAPLWQIRLMKAGSAVWFVIYYIIASVTIAPLSVFVKGLGHFFKRTWIGWVGAFIFYLMIVGCIVLVTLGTQNNWWIS